MSLESLGLILKATTTPFQTSRSTPQASKLPGRTPSRLGAKAPRVTKSTVKKSCGEHKSVWWKCRSGLALSNPKVSTSLSGGLERNEQNGFSSNGGSSKGKGLGLEVEEGGLI